MTDMSKVKKDTKKKESKDRVYYGSKKDIQTHTYAIGFYDAFDGWHYPNRSRAKLFKSLDQAKAECNKKMKDLDNDNKGMGEHYSVFDERDKEIYRGH